MFKTVVNNINAHIEKRNSETVPEPVFTCSFDNNKIKDLERYKELEDNVLFNIIRQNYSYILNAVIDTKNPAYLEAFRDLRFLTMFIQVVSNVQLTMKDIVCCNKLSYDYLTHNNAINDVRGLFFNLSKIVNRAYLPGLLGLGLDEDFASYLLLSRFSSTKEEVNIRRLNYLLMTSDPNIVDEQMIIYIYEKLFNSMSILFTGVMFNTYNNDELSAVSHTASEIYSNISLAIIDILNQQSSEIIRSTLIAYAGDYSVRGNCDVRFYMDSLAKSEYARILNVVSELETLELIIVP